MKTIWFFVLLFVAAPATYAATTINWGTTAGTTVSPAAAPPATGAPLTYFYLGAFTPGFTPTAANRSEWLANWTTVGSQRLFVDGFFNQASRLESNTSNTPRGGRAYVWGVSGNEWTLLTSDLWTWPNANDIINPGVPTFQISRSTTDATFGTISADGTAISSAVSNNAAAPTISADRFLELFELDDFADDPDQDGLTNLEEFALAGNPTSATSRPTLQVAAIGPDLQITLPKGTLDRVTLGFQRSTTLSAWTGGVTFDRSASPISDIAIIANGGAPRQFYRALYTR